jgi:hypothetical protein
MSAVSTSDVTGTALPAHRTDAPVWAFHLALAWIVWGAATAVHKLAAWEDRHATRTGVLAAVTFTAIAVLAAAITGTVVFA